MPLDNTEFYFSQIEDGQYEWIESPARALELLTGFGQSIWRALDFETTSLFPWDGGTIRLTTITDANGTYVIDHFKAGHFELYAEIVAKLKWVVYNACFEGRWIDYYTEGTDMECQVELLDIQFLRKAKMGGGPSSLAIQAKKDLKVDMDKTQQNSGWGNEVLTQEQRDYAAFDGLITYKIYSKWRDELSPEQWGGALVINSAWRGNAEMEDTGLQLDVEYHKTLLDRWVVKKATAERYLRKWTPKEVISNLNSNQQIGNFLKEQVLDKEAVAGWPKTGKTKQMDMSRDVLRQAAHRLPYPVSRWIAALMIYRKMGKYTSTYGQKLIDSQLRTGRIASRFNMAQAVTCRYSSSSFNLQNIPNSPVVRRSFIAMKEAFLEGHVPTGRDKVMVLADYSSIEVRVLAELSSDEQLKYDAIFGDVHSRSASKIFNIDFDEFVQVLNEKDPNDPEKLNPRFDNLRPLYKSMRTRAKSFTFQLLYGAGAAALAVVLRCSDEEAHDAIMAWAALYQKAYHYRTLMFEQMNFNGYIPVVDGRTIFVWKSDRTMPVAANYPVQSAAASVMYRAIYWTHRLLWESGIPCRMAATVHDELLLYSQRQCSEQAKEILEKGMVKGWLDIFKDTNVTGLVDAKVGKHWGDK